MARKKNNKKTWNKNVNDLSCECDLVETEFEGPVDDVLRGIDCVCSNDKDMNIITTKRMGVFQK